MPMINIALTNAILTSLNGLDRYKCLNIDPELTAIFRNRAGRILLIFRINLSLAET